MRHWAGRVARSTLLALAAEIFARLANTIFFILLTWRLGEAEASTYALGFTFTTFLMPLALGGLDQLLAREVGHDAEHSALLLGNFTLARALSSLLCYAGLLAWLAGPYGFDPAINLVVVVLGATIISDNIVNLAQAYLIARDRVGWITVLGLITGGAKLVLGALILMLGGGALAAAWIVLATSIVACVAYLGLIWLNFGPPRFSADRSFWALHARAGYPLLMIAILATVEGSFDALLLSRRGNPVEVGVYAAATTVLNALLMLPTTYRQVVLPIMSSWYHTVRERAYEIYVQSARMLLILSLLVSMSLTLIADQIMPLMYHNEFAGSVGVIEVLAWSFVFTCLVVPNARLMLVAGRQAATVPIQVAAVILNVALNLALQPYVAAQGAAIARVASTGLLFLGTLVYVRGRIHRWALWPIVAGPLGASVCFMLATLGLRWLGLHWLLALALGWLVYGVALFVFRGISVVEVRSLLALMQRRAAHSTVRGSR